MPEWGAGVAAPAGLFVPGRGLLYRLHPRSKASLLVAAALLAFAPWPLLPHAAWWPLLLTLAFGALALTSGRALAASWARRLLLTLAPLALSLVLVQGLFFPGAREVLILGPLELKLEGLRFALVTVGRLAVVIGALLLVGSSTHPADLAQAMQDASWPHELVYVVVAALALLPRLAAQARAISEAQQARGLALGGGLRGRLSALPPLLGPLVLAALHEAQARAYLLEARAFRGPGPKTSLRALADSPAERLLRRTLLGASLLLFALGQGVAWRL